MIIDISWPITEGMTEYKDRSTACIKQLKSIEEHGVQECSLSFHNHTGTHIDAPAHFVAGGKTVDQLALETFIGPCVVLDLVHIQEKITDRDLADYTFNVGDRILLKTRNSERSTQEPFDYDFVYLAESGARLLADRNIRLVGIDYLGIERNQVGHPTHKALLSNNISILEGLRLAQVHPGVYALICLPLSIQGTDAVPARALLQSL